MRPDGGLGRVYIGCFGSGLGHAMRMLSVARFLREKGVEVCFSSSSEVSSFIKWNGFPCNELPHADVYYNDDGELSVKHTLLSSPTILARTYQQVQLEVANMKRFGPDAVLADSVLSTVLAGRILGKQVVTVLNQLRIEASARDFRARFRVLSAGLSEGMGALWGLSDRILLPDLPPPHTISEKNLWNSRHEIVRYIGFLTPHEITAGDAYLFGDSAKPRVFWQVSGPPGTRSPLVKKALEIAKANSDSFNFVITGGIPGGETVAERIPGGWYLGWCTSARQYFEACDLVVARAGHGTVAQAIVCGKPSLLVPIHKQTEQEGNAKKAVKLGISVAMEQEELEPGAFREVADRLLGTDYRQRVESLSREANRFDARSEIFDSLQGAR